MNGMGAVSERNGVPDKTSRNVLLHPLRVTFQEGLEVVTAQLLVGLLHRSLLVGTSSLEGLRIGVVAELAGPGIDPGVATAVAAVLDCRTRVMKVAVAGHPPAILLRPGEPPRALEAEGSLLGVFPDEHYEEIEIEVRSKLAEKGAPTKTKAAAAD